MTDLAKAVDMTGQIKERHDKLKGPFGFCGVRTTLDCINEYTEFCSTAIPQLLAENQRLEQLVAKYEQVVAELEATNMRWKKLNEMIRDEFDGETK